jgi:uncharacterized protein DUF3604
VSRVHQAIAALLLACAACEGSDQDVGAIEGARRRDGAEVARVAAGEDRVLFGDLHVHSTYSIDAFLYGLPFFGGEGAHPPADACDFARYCSELDFFALTDHAEGLTPSRWRHSIESLRDCNERAGDPADPDLVAYVGWEWTQTGATPETHFGHKNVIFPGLADSELPARPISALSDDVMQRARFMWLARGAEAAFSYTLPAYADFLWWVRQLADTPLCTPGVDVRAQPPDCQEAA